ncbi:hypothetical protein [Methylophaga thalassica]|nr:hypothetical protein [Methylophaga aminisulfidivorans]
MNDLVLNIFISIIVGVLAGIHSGIVVSRMAKFEEIRNQVKKIILGIDFIQESHEIKFFIKKDITELSALSSDLYAMKHPKSADSVARLFQEINEYIHNYKSLNATETMNQVYTQWQRECRQLRPNYRVIFSLRLWV